MDQLGAAEGSGTSVTDFLGYEGQKFSFEHVPQEVTFVGASAKLGRIDAVVSWLAQVA